MENLPMKILIRRDQRWEPVEPMNFEGEDQLQRLLKESSEVIPTTRTRRAERGASVSSLAYFLPPGYTSDFDQMLATLGATPGLVPDRLTVFWPKVGTAYAGELMVVGKAVNGWIDEIATERLGSQEARARVLDDARLTAEGDGNVDPMAWVTAAWGRGDGAYSTARSAYWRHARTVLAALDPSSASDAAWSSRLAWSNLVKVAPAAGGNPGGKLLHVQRRHGCALLAREIEEYRPRRVLVSTGRWWFEPFAEALGLDVSWQTGLVDGTATSHGTRWVIARHPQGKPRSINDDVVAAFGASP